ncbi:MAG: enoyl-CoA hydratase/isomerase family protein [Pseudomonas sp.]
MLANTPTCDSSSSPVSYTRHACVGVIRIDNPPVNALSQAVRQGLLLALRTALDDGGAHVLVMLAAGRTFIAGADIREFGKPAQPPFLSDVIAALEASTKPLIAVLHGTALGGGLEVALGCHLRIALEGTRVGLPEVKLGLLPGAGGTQRLPRLVGVECALDMITSGRFMAVDEARRNGIVDEVTDADNPLKAGLAAAEKLLLGHYTPRCTGQLPAPAADADACERYRQHLTNHVPYQFSPFRCVDAVEASFQLSFSEGLKRERALFLACMASAQRLGLVHAFFATRGNHKVPGVNDDSLLTTLGLIGQHPFFDVLVEHAAKAGVHLINLDAGLDTAVQACLIAAEVAPQKRQEIMRTLPAGTPRIDMVVAGKMPANFGVGAASLVLSPCDASQPICELVDHHDQPALIQALANTLKALKRHVVVTSKVSVIATLNESLTRTLADGGSADATVAAWRTEGWDLSLWLIAHSTPPISEDEAKSYRRPLDVAWQQAADTLVAAGHVHRPGDIDVLAIQAFGYPQHLGGPHFRAQICD